MGPIDGLLYGLKLVLTWQNLLAAFVGALAGTAIGVLPGLGPIAGIAIIMPITYALEPNHRPDHDGRYFLWGDVRWFNHCPYWSICLAKRHRW